MFEVIASIGLVVALAAGVLWLVEWTANRIGSRNTWLLFLVGVPFLLGAVVAFVNRSELAWWQVVLLPVGSPAIAIVVLLVAYMAVNPVALIALVGAMLRWVCARVFASRHR